MNLEEQLQQWVILDNQLKSVSEKVKEIRDKKIFLLNKLINMLKPKI